MRRLLLVAWLRWWLVAAGLKAVMRKYLWRHGMY
jgi:hypothetical protein